MAPINATAPELRFACSTSGSRCEAFSTRAEARIPNSRLRSRTQNPNAYIKFVKHCYIMTFLEVKDLRVSIDGKEILSGLNLKVEKGEVHAIMGPNGSGKSTLANAILWHPKYSIQSGDILVKGESILKMPTDQRAKKGLFLGFQYPTEISGVGYSHFL